MKADTEIVPERSIEMNFSPELSCNVIQNIAGVTDECVNE